MDFKNIIFEKDGRIATITFNRPQRLNAISHALREEFEAAIEQVAGDSSLRVLILTGAGRAFCAGGDFKGDVDGSSRAFIDPERRRPEFLQSFLRSYTHRTVLSLQNLNIPTIAMVNGPAVGAGFDWAMACDMRIGSENTRFCVAWLRRGVISAMGASWLLPRVIGVAKAAELIFTARFVEAEEAERIGLLNRLVPSERLHTETLELARSLAEGPPIAIRLMKMNLYKGLQLDYATALDFLTACQAIAINTEDAAEGAAAFREKRAAMFKGR